MIKIMSEFTSVFIFKKPVERIVEWLKVSVRNEIYPSTLCVVLCLGYFVL